MVSMEVWGEVKVRKGSWGLLRGAPAGIADILALLHSLKCDSLSHTSIVLDARRVSAATLERLMTSGGSSRLTELF